MARKAKITHSVNFVDFNNKEWPYKYVDCTSLEDAKLAFMDILLGFGETVSVEKMKNHDTVADIIERVEVNGPNTHAIIAIQAIG